MSPTPSTAEKLVVAPSQPRPGLLLIRVLGDVDPHGAARCTRVLRGAIEAAAAEHDIRGACARVVCDVTGVGELGDLGLGVLADAADHARDRGVAFDVVHDASAVGGDVTPTPRVAG